ncbi:transcriptional regulator [Actinobacillus pleuropneumoniae]|nr:transcriptional regulator [Actinobacillus pleuropneumoniae]
MFDILLPEQSEFPLYQQLYLQLREGIRNGEIPDGQRLPSVRSLQLQLNISKTPIETAYQMLTAEGYVISKPRSGLYVMNPYKELTYSQQHRQPPSMNMMSVIRSHAHINPNVIDFNPTRLDQAAFPVRIWNKMLKEALDHHLCEIGMYGDPQGEYALRRVVSEYLRNSRGVNSTPDQIVIGAGTAYSIGLLSRMLKGMKRVAVEEPGYSLVRDQFQLNGFEILPISLGDKGISLDRLEQSHAELVYVTPSHQFPTGTIMPYPERERLLEWANAKNAYIIEDDYDGEFRYQGKPIASLQGLDDNGRVIYAGTFSKVLTPALRMNYLVLPQALQHQLAQMRQEVYFAPSRVEQWAMTAFLNRGIGSAIFAKFVTCTRKDIIG